MDKNKAALEALDFLEKRYRMIESPSGAIEHTVEALHTIRAALTSGGWQDISTAPRDGTEVLGCHVWQSETSSDLNYCMAIIKYCDPYDDGSGDIPSDPTWVDVACSEFITPTHWMPLPQPPKEKP